jgi:WD40 repeat protein
MDSLTESEHPSVQQLRTFGLGQMGAAEAAVIEEHVAHCEACCRTLAGVRSDTFIDILKGSSQADPGAKPNEAPTMAPGEPAPIDVPAELLRHPRYRVLGLLGAGGMGAVYKAEHRLMERVVALKVMSPTVVGSAATVDRFRREVKAAACLSHPNIVAAYDAEQAGDLHFLVMEYVEGTDLARRVAERGQLLVEEACEYARQCAAGLQHAHEHGMVHRDIKPHNLMRTPDGTVKILDFGLARLAAEAGTALSGVTRQGTLLGTVDYLAPEQADDARRADIRADIYSLGCTLYHLLSGRPPFPQGTMVQKVMAHTDREPVSLQELRPDLPPGLSRVVRRMMAKAPEDRYQTPAKVCAALAPFTGTTLALDPAPLRRKRAARRKVSGTFPRRRWPVVVAALLLALVGIVAAAVYRIQTDNAELVISTDNPDVEVVIKQNGKVVRIIDTKTGKEVKLDSGFYELELAGQGEGLKLSLDRVTIHRGETVVATVTRKGKAAGAAAANPRPPAKPALLFTVPWQDEEQGFPAFIGITGISSDGRLFFGAGDAGPSGRIRLFDLATGKLVRELVPGSDVWFSFAQLLPGSKYLVASYNRDNDLYLWDVAAGKVVRKFVGHTEPEPHFAVSPDGKRLLSWADDKTVRLWEVETGKELRKLEGHADKAAGVFSPDGKQVLTFSPDKTLRLWDVESGKELKKLEGHTDACTGCFSPEGKQALSYGPDGTIRLWDLGTGKELRRFEGPRSAVSFAGFVANGRQVVARSDEQEFRVWEAASGKLIGDIDYARYGGDGWTITASPDGRLALVQVKDDASVRVLALPGGEELHRFDGCPRARAWSFFPDGTLAVAGSFRAGMYVFRLPAPPQENGDRRRP